jgi:DnaJ-class molecular chaperone
MEYKDYYKTLGVPKTASAKEIKAAYRKLARKHHPDVNQGNRQAEARFKEVNEANDVLSDPEKRRRYDQLGADWDRVGPRAASGWPGGARTRVHVGGDPDLGDFSDFFKTFFGGFGGGEAFQGFGAPGEPPGHDLETAVELTLEEVLRGTTRRVRLDSGSSVEVKIPPGVREGSRVRVAKAGGGSGRNKGDLYLRVLLRPDPRFERRGDDLQGTFSVPVTTAVLGGEASVPTLDGPVGIKVAPGTPVGRTFRLRGHGLPRLEGGGRGDVLATLSVSLPKELSSKERELFEELRRLGH